MECFHTSKYLTLHRTDAGSIVMRRTSQPFESIDAMKQAFEPLLHALRADRAFTGGLVINSSAVQGRNDPAFEEALKAVIRGFSRLAKRIAIVVISAPGTMQSRRLGADLPASQRFLVYSDERTAIAAVEPSSER